MATEPTTGPTGVPTDGSAGDLAAAYDLLQQLLDQNGGVISSMQLKRDLISRLSIEESRARDLAVELKFLDDAAAHAMSRPRARTYHHGRSFYTEAGYNEVLAQTEEEAKEAGLQDQEPEKTEEEEPKEKEAKQNRQEEARLGAYVKRLLQDIYGSDFAPDENEYVFDVHADRPGSTYENVDIIAAHWRSETIVDLITVEVKLEFSAKAVHQACNYTRFAHRAWVAVVVTTDINEAALELRGLDSGLFDYAVSRGLGIIACRRKQGGAYQAFPIHWPIWHNPEPVDREQFLERYRGVFEEAGVLEPQKKRPSAKF